MLIPRLVKNPRELLAAGLGGVVATGVDVGVLILLVERHVSIPVAAFLAAMAGAGTNFVMNKYVAFRDSSPITVQQLTRFGVVAVTTAMLMAFAMKVVAVHLGVPYVIAKILCAAIIFAAWTYPAQRRLVFSRPSVAHA